MAPSRKKLGEILIEMGAVDALQLQSAIAYHQQWGIPLGRAVVEKRFCSDDDVLRALSLQTGHPVLRLDGVPLDPKLTSVLPLKVAERLRAVPLRLRGKRDEVLVVAVAAPGGIDTIDTVYAATGKKVEVHLSHDVEVNRAIAALYHGRMPEIPPEPAAEALASPVGIAEEVEFELTAEDEVRTVDHPVRLFGWNEAALRALKAMIERSGIRAEPIREEELESLQPGDVLIASTLGLQSVLPPGATLEAKLIICGVKDDLDVEDARSLGARLYLRPPFSTEQIEGAVRHLAS